MIILTKNFINILSIVFFVPRYKFMSTTQLINSPIDSQKFKLTKMTQFWIWVKKFQENNNIIISAVGRPTAPLYPPIKQGMQEYLDNLKDNEAIEYGNLQGEGPYRERMASVLTKWYGTKFSAENILFTNSGKMSLSTITYLISKINKDKHVVTTSPYYPDHLGDFSGLYDHFYKFPKPILVDVLKDNGLNAENLINTIKDVNKEKIGAFIFCVPNNPMGWVISETEWRKISNILLEYENAVIVLDEAYAEMVFSNEKYQSLVNIASDNLKNRIILLRSATKGFSASGERISLIATWNNQYMQELLNYHSMNLIHTPKIMQ